MENQTNNTVQNAPKKRGPKPKAKLDLNALLGTAEGNALISELTARITSQLVEKRESVGTIAQDGDNSLARRLAMAIAEISDQGSGRKRLPPEVLESRRIATEKMNDKLIQFRAEGTVPEYGLTRAVYLDEVLVAPSYVDRNHVLKQTHITWPHVPNEGMVPMNAAAKEVFALFMDSIGGAAPDVTRPDQKAAVIEKAKRDLAVLHEDGKPKEAPQVGKPRGDMGLRIVGDHQPGDVIQTNVLGTIAPAARQLA